MNYPIHIYDTQTQGKPVICLAHANGFPPEMYTPLAAALGTDYHRVCLPSRPWWGDVETFTDWHMLADDLAAGIRQHQLAPVVGVGHSMNGVAMTFAAVKYPELFRGIVMLDPVFMPRWLVRITPFLKLFGVYPTKRLVQGALKRRREWDSVEDAYQRFRKRSLFARCSDEVVRLYVEGITRPTENGVELVYTPEWEAKIFSSVPVDEWRYPPRVPVPALILGGAESDTFLKPAVRLWQNMRPDIPIHLIPETGHLLPMEKPQAVAQLIQEFLWDAIPHSEKVKNHA